MEHHRLMGGRLHVYRRDNSRYWQCSTFIGGKNRRTTTKEESIALAKDIAEDWYLELKGKHKRGEIKEGKPFRDAAEKFRNEYETLMEGRRNPQYIKDHVRRIDKYLLPFFGDKVLPEVTPALVQDYRIHRRKLAMERWGKAPARQTIHQEIVTLRQILKAANGVSQLPPFHVPSALYISHCRKPKAFHTMLNTGRIAVGIRYCPSGSNEIITSRSKLPLNDTK